MLRDLRLKHGYRQAELAEGMGYEQTYWSALELGTKGPPPLAFIQKLVEALGLDGETAEALHQAAEDSNRHMTLSVGSSTVLYRVFNEFRRQVETMHPAQLALIEQALSLRAELKEGRSLDEGSPRIRRRHFAQSEGG